MSFIQSFAANVDVLWYLWVFVCWCSVYFVIVGGFRRSISKQETKINIETIQNDLFTAHYLQEILVRRRQISLTRRLVLGLYRYGAHGVHTFHVEQGWQTKFKFSSEQDKLVLNHRT